MLHMILEFVAKQPHANMVISSIYLQQWDGKNVIHPSKWEDFTNNGPVSQPKPPKTAMHIYAWQGMMESKRLQVPGWCCFFFFTSIYLLIHVYFFIKDTLQNRNWCQTSQTVFFRVMITDHGHSTRIEPPGMKSTQSYPPVMDDDVGLKPRWRVRHML